MNKCNDIENHEENLIFEDDPIPMPDLSRWSIPDFCIRWSNGIINGYVSRRGCSPVDLTDGEEGTLLPECDWIGPEAFKKCNVLRSVSIRNRNYRMGSGVFAGCKNLEKVVLPEGMESIVAECFRDCGALSDVQLPESLTEIHICAFEACGALKIIRLPQALQVIELSAFMGCSSLEEIELPDSLEKMGDEVFANCVCLKKVKLSAGLKVIPEWTFANCVSLEEIEIPEGVTEIEFGAFAGCVNLKRIVLPKSLVRLDPYAFYRCKALDTVEHPDPEKFAEALRRTPYWKKLHPNEEVLPQVPMEVLNHISGPVDGATLCAMGYTWFRLDNSYRIFRTKDPNIWEVQEDASDDGLEDEEAESGTWLMDGNLFPIAATDPKREQPDKDPVC